MLRRLLHFFPVQLLINHFKSNHILLGAWLVLFGIITGHIGGFLGLQYLFLSPEYLGESGFWSFLIIGVALGGLTMTFHSTICLIDMHKFPFLGALSRPFAKLCLNNSVIPLTYLVVYIVTVTRFQRLEQKNTLIDVFIKNLGLLTGFTLVSLAMFMYMAMSNKDVFSYHKKTITGRVKQALVHRINRVRRLWFTKKNTFSVSSYLESPFRIGYTKDLDRYYDPAIVTKIFNQNQLNLIFFEIMAVLLLFALGFWSNHAFSQIPAAASGILCLAILMMFVGLLSFWARGWTATIIVLLVVLCKVLASHGISLGTRESQALGMYYEGDKADYTLTQIRELNSKTNYYKDKQATLKILENWRKKFPATEAPKLIIICASGGGHKAALWVLRVLQTADSVTHGKLMKHTMLMSCVSGGALGASYFRELYLRNKLGEASNPYDTIHLDKIAHNKLNPIIFNLVTNDMLLNTNKCQYQGRKYRRDRGYALEEQVNQYTDAILDKPLKAYQVPELRSIIPMLLLTPTIINDGRKLFVSPHGVSYMSTAPTKGEFAEESGHGKVRGIDFIQLFKEQGGEDLRFLSALRMTATYPYVLPSITLPSDPAIEVMDGGIFDNFGVTDAVQFMSVFQDWIKKHTSGVILITIRSTIKEKEARRDPSKHLFSKLNNPIGTLQANWLNIQDIRNENLIKLANASFAYQVENIEFQYTPIRRGKGKIRPGATSLKWYLTTEEKQHIIQSIYDRHNQYALERLRSLLK
ncbi:MAG: patatin-like phospholipase family protein [Bacteroidota bacterium]